MWENHTEKEILEVLRDIRRVIERALLKHRPVSSVLQILVKGDNTMPATIQVGGKGAKAVYQEFDGPNGTGNKVPPVGTMQYSSDNPGVATVDTSGNITAVAPGTASITGNDSGANLPASDSVTVTAPVQGPVSATLTVVAN
jgi:hypothetical protein